jgi:outer membrane lipoprotein SlyB
MKTLILGTTLLAAVTATGCVSAPYHSGHERGYYSGGSSYYSSAQPRDCWRERVGSTTYTPEITGAIIGGAIGNQFGSGSGRDIATVAGAALGGSVGHDYKNRRYGSNYRVVCR